MANIPSLIGFQPSKVVFHIYVSFPIKCPFIPTNIPLKSHQKIPLKSNWNPIKILLKAHWNPVEIPFHVRVPDPAFKAASVPSSSSMRRKVLCATKADSATRWYSVGWTETEHRVAGYVKVGGFKPSENMSQLGLFPIYAKMFKNVPNHQAAVGY